MKSLFNPRKLTHIGQTRGCAAVAFSGSSLELTAGRADGGDVQVLQQATASAAPPEDAQIKTPQWQVAAQALRRHFEVDAESIVLAALTQLERQGAFGLEDLARAVKDLGIDPEKIDPASA